jgi:hypothetical protein
MTTKTNYHFRWKCWCTWNWYMTGLLKSREIYNILPQTWPYDITMRHPICGIFIYKTYGTWPYGEINYLKLFILVMGLDAPSGYLPFLVILAGGWSEETGDFVKPLKEFARWQVKLVRCTWENNQADI